MTPTDTLYPKQTFRELLCFGIVGGVQYIVDVGTFSLLVSVSGYPIASNLVSRALAAPCGYYLNRRLTFRVLGRKGKGSGKRYILALLTTTALSTTLVKSISLLSHVVDRPVYLVYGKAIIEVVLFLVGFLLCKLWIFVPRSHETDEDREDSDGVSVGITSGSASGVGKGILFILAHTDDEYFVVPRMRAAVRAGHNVYCVYTTDGEGYGVAPEVRACESRNALRSVGVPAENLFFVGVEAAIRDGSSHLRLGDMYEAVYQAVRELLIDEIYVLCWEGGHVDHDASHLVGAALAGVLGIEDIYECPGYNCYRATSPLFRVMTWVPRQETVSTLRFGLADGFSCFSLCAYYRSQRKTFLGLAPESFVRFVIQRRHGRRRVAGIDYMQRPHDGPLLYEKRFGVPYDEFRDATAGFISERLTPRGSRALTGAGG